MCLCGGGKGGGDFHVSMSHKEGFTVSHLVYCSESQVTIVDSCTNAIQYRIRDPISIQWILKQLLHNL